MINGMKCYLIRHARTLSNKNNIYAGRGDESVEFPVDSSIMNTVLALQENKVVTIYSSPVRRARETALLIANALNVEVIVDDRLSELNFGSWTGKHGKEIASEDEILWQKWRDKPFDVVPGGMDSLDALHQRYQSWVKEVRRNNEEVAAITHETLIKAAICFHSDDRNRCYRSVQIKNGALHEIEI